MRGDTMLDYKGYHGEAFYDEEIGMFSGRITNAKAIGTFYGKTVDEIETEFKKTIDYYLELCMKKNIEPEKPFSGKFNLRISPELHRKIYRASKEEGKSINNWIQEKIEAIVA
jgi:predicted HicB family RNase H-like nuclease